MLRPRAWERGHGVIHALTPLGLDRELTSALAERNGGAPGPALAHYRGGSETRVQSFAGAALLNPGKLWAQSGVNAVDVTDGDTLCCACSVAEARAGRCHRAWAAPFLVRAGWRVVLDGVEVAGG